jgi:hypothetical protein
VVELHNVSLASMSRGDQKGNAERVRVTAFVSPTVAERAVRSR